MIDLGNGKYRPLEEINSGLKLQELVKAQIEFQKSIGDTYEASSLLYMFQSLLKESKK